jgi:hypothetical protein
VSFVFLVFLRDRRQFLVLLVVVGAADGGGGVRRAELHAVVNVHFEQGELVHEL